MIHRYIFLLKDNIVSVFSVNDKVKYTAMRDCGETEIEIENDFWTWWKEAVSFLSDDEVDFCFIYDKEYSILEDEFLKICFQTEKSVWNTDYLRKFFEYESSLSNIRLIDNTENELIFNRSKLSINNEENILYTNIKIDGLKKLYQSKNNNKALISENDNDNDNDNVELAPMAKYYIHTLEEEKFN